MSQDAATPPAGVSRFVIGATWEDAPHLSETTKATLRNSYQPFQRDARTRGIPQLGAGNVYQFPASEITVQPFLIPKHWPRGYGMDTDQGEGPTAAVWAAEDPETKTTYIYDVYKKSRMGVIVNAAAIKLRGASLNGVADAAAIQMKNEDAEQLIQLYREQGLHLTLPNKHSVETGIEIVWTRFSMGTLKVFATCAQWFAEYRLYRRNERGQIVKKFDHLMDASRYLVASVKDGRLKLEPLEELMVDNGDDDRFGGHLNDADAWMV